MIERITAPLSYANVTATVALFIALGGSSYAALTLPRNSVGSNQIRNSAVRSTDIRDRTIRLRDISRATRGSLRGAQGPVGAVGPQGPAAVSLFAAVNAAGSFGRGNATQGGHGTAIGTYTVGFARPVAGCVCTATIGTTDGTAAPTGRITVRDDGANVGVSTFDDAGSPADRPFHLTVAC